MANEPPFSGKGLERDEFTENERQQHREMFREISQAWPSIKWLDNIRNGGRSLGAVVTGLMLIGAALAYLSDRGVF